MRKFFSVLGLVFTLFAASMTYGFVLLSFVESYNDANPWFHITTFTQAFLIGVTPWLIALIGGAVTRSRKATWIIFGVAMVLVQMPGGAIASIVMLIGAGTWAAIRRREPWHVCNREGPPFVAVDERSYASRSYPTCSVCNKPQTA